MDLVKLIEPSLPKVSVGLVNQLLLILGRSGKIETMMKLFFKIVASNGDINFDTYAILLKNLLSVGSWRKYIEVLQWMVDAGIRPSSRMYLDISSFAQKSGGAEYATLITGRIELLKRKSGHQDSISKMCYTHSASSLTSRTKVENYKLLESTMAVTYPVSDC